MRVIAALIKILPVYLLEEKEKGNYLRLSLLIIAVCVNEVVLCI